MLNPGMATFHVEAYAPLAVLKIDVHKLNSATVRERLPIRLEVLTLEPGAANLLGKKTIFYRVIDVLEKLTVDPFVNRRRDPVRIDKQDSTFGSPAA